MYAYVTKYLCIFSFFVCKWIGLLCFYSIIMGGWRRGLGVGRDIQL